MIPTHLRGQPVASGAIVNDGRLAEMIRMSQPALNHTLSVRSQVLYPQRLGNMVASAYQVQGMFAVKPGDVSQSITGDVHITPATTQYQSCSLLAPLHFLPAVGEKLQFFARFGLDDLDETDFLVGISNEITKMWDESDSGALLVDDFIGFFHANDDDADAMTFRIIYSGTVEDYDFTLPFSLADDVLYDWAFAIHGIGIGTRIDICVAPVGTFGANIYYNEIVTYTHIAHPDILPGLTAANFVNAMGMTFGSLANDDQGNSAIIVRAASVVQPF